jgi:hypothetical protein
LQVTFASTSASTAVTESNTKEDLESNVSDTVQYELLVGADGAARWER